MENFCCEIRDAPTRFSVHLRRGCRATQAFDDVRREMMLCFEVSKNGKKVAHAGLRESGVLSLILSWVGREQGASALAAATQGPIPDLDFSVAGIDSSDPASDRSVAWVE